MEEPAELLPPREPSLLCGASVFAAATPICTEWGLPAPSQLTLEPELASEHGRANEGKGQEQSPAWPFLKQNSPD